MELRLRTLLFIAGLAIASTGCDQRSRPALAGEKETARAVRLVSAVTVDQMPDGIPDDLAITGAIGSRTLTAVASELPGKVVAVLVTEGQKVVKGQVVAVLDDEQIKLQVVQAEKAHAMAQTQIKQLNVVAGIESDSLEQGLKQAEAGLRQVQAQAKLVHKGARPEQKKQVAAAAEAARTFMAGMKREYERMLGLHEKQAIPGQQVDQLQDSYKAAKAQYRQAELGLKLIRLGARKEEIEGIEATVDQMMSAVELARISLRRVEATKLQIEAAQIGAEQAEKGVEMAKLALEKTKILSPVNGVADSVMVEAGQVTNPGIPLMMINPSKDLELLTYLNDGDVAGIRPGMSVEYEVDALAIERGASEGTVTAVSTTPDQRSGAYAVRISVGTEQNEDLKAGMFIRGVIHKGKVRPGTLLIPIDALLRASGERFVMVVNGAKAKRRVVKTGIRHEQKVEILSGLSPMDKILVAGHVGLADGADIQISTAEVPGGGE